jgi:hypothetical protein
VAFYGLLWAVTGFDLLGSIASTEQIYRASIARIRPYSYWLTGSPTAWLVTLGLPLAWYTVRSVAPGAATGRAAAGGHAAAVALAIVVIVATVGGFSKAETERIWLFLVPFACVAAASVLPGRRLALVLGALAVQAFLSEHLLGTIW